MSKIIVAIDFSDCSINAFLHALSIAQKCRIDITLVWVQKTVSETDKFEDPSNALLHDVDKQFNELISRYQPELPFNKITYKIRTGKVYKEITSEAKETHAMLVVAGTHGASGFEEFWIGSNANRIIASSPCPVITIRAGINIQRPLSKIVVPIDSTIETRQKATFTAYLAKMHQAEAFILALYTSKVKEIRYNVDVYAQQVAAHFEKEGVKFHVKHMESNNISESMISYAKTLDANLISVMTEQETSTSNLWMGPYAHQTVNHSPIPVLSIHPILMSASGPAF
ncbi:MAG: universal stress protein [Bacteroidetes bacterium]|nr:universal stress protein [Bacteroidota bacterium]